VWEHHRQERPRTRGVVVDEDEPKPVYLLDSDERSGTTERSNLVLDEDKKPAETNGNESFGMSIEEAGVTGSSHPFGLETTVEGRSGTDFTSGAIGVVPEIKAEEGPAEIASLEMDVDADPVGT
jgi:hypothetical protein